MPQKLCHCCECTFLSYILLSFHRSRLWRCCTVLIGGRNAGAGAADASLGAVRPGGRVHHPRWGTEHGLPLRQEAPLPLLWLPQVDAFPLFPLCLPELARCGMSPRCDAATETRRRNGNKLRHESHRATLCIVAVLTVGCRKRHRGVATSPARI